MTTANNIFETASGEIQNLPEGWTFFDFTTAIKDIIPGETQLWVSPDFDGDGENLGGWMASLVDVQTDELIDHIAFTLPLIDGGNDWIGACNNVSSMKW